MKVRPKTLRLMDILPKTNVSSRLGEKLKSFQVQLSEKFRGNEMQSY